ncbi:hypothetical protein IKF20_02895 [Candidatus Saccharibacteria bacterium]|nr:hypothetical protein [Candidatus Saccharibacteria bacterium]
MKTLKDDLIKIYQTERGILLLMIFNVFAALALLIFSIIALNPEAPVVRVGYGDIGGYRDGTWIGLLTFPILAVVFGVFHNILTLRIFHKRGAGMAKFFLITTSCLIFGTALVLIRLLGEE